MIPRSGSLDVNLDLHEHVGEDAAVAGASAWLLGRPGHDPGPDFRDLHDCLPGHGCLLAENVAAGIVAHRR